jgi:hypothetical protein
MRAGKHRPRSSWGSAVQALALRDGRHRAIAANGIGQVVSEMVVVHASCVHSHGGVGRNRAVVTITGVKLWANALACIAVLLL